MYSRLWTLILLVGVSCAPPLFAQIRPLELTVSVRSETEGGRPSLPVLLNGYRASVDGMTIRYHSSHPDAEDALIVRANAEAHAATWMTDTIPSHYEPDTVTFLWLAGMERAGWGESKNGHRFTLSVDGAEWFTFRNYKDSNAARWTAHAPNGSTLRWVAQKADKFGDQFGTLELAIPKKVCGTGKPLALRVEGEQANSLEWFMTFQYRFNFTPRVTAEPALFRESNGATQVLRLSLDNLVAGRSVEVSSNGVSALSTALNVGSNIWTLPIPAVDRPSPMVLRFRIDGNESLRQDVEIRPVIKRDIFLVSHSHNDIGYTDLQPRVERKQWENLDLALKLIDATRDYPEDARFRWNIEVLWPLESYLKQATPEKREKLLAAIRGGRIGVNALYGNELTGLATAVEMSHFTDFAREFSREYSFPITTAVMSDIPGFTWGIVPALAQSGVRYFASGPNSGDRIGYVLQEWGDKPFYWTSPSGGEKVLFWVAGAGYSSFHEGTLERLGDERVMKLVRKLDEIQYPYDILHLPYTQGDNGPPDTTLSDFVRRWNAKYLSPRLIISTHETMFRELERRYGDKLPAYGGDFTPYWEDGALSTAYETALARRAVDRLVQGEVLWSMCAPEKFPGRAYDEAWRKISLWDEHTWGADKSVSDPDLPGVIGQWQIKRQFALDADSLSRLLLKLALPAGAKKGSVDVYNTNGFERSGVVLIPPELSAGGDRVSDERGRPVHSQRLASGELAILVDRIAPMSARRFAIRSGRMRPEPAHITTVLENEVIRLEINRVEGTIDHFVWKKRGLDFAGARGLNRYLYVPGTNADSAVTLSNVRVAAGESGPLLSSCIIEGDAPGCRTVSMEVRLFRESDEPEIITTIDKKAVRTKEGLHFAFPFNIPNGELSYDVANGIVRPEANQLPGSCRNFFSVQSWFDVSNDGAGITVATPDAPLIELGSITAEKPWLKAIDRSSTVFSYVMNNYWHTNYKADQEGIAVFRYVLKPHGSFDPALADAFGRKYRSPLIAVAASEKSLRSSLFRLRGDGIVVESVRPLAAGSWLLFLYNPTDRDREPGFVWNARKGVVYSASDGSGMKGHAIANGIVVKARGLAYLRVDRR